MGDNAVMSVWGLKGTNYKGGHNSRLQFLSVLLSNVQLPNYIGHKPWANQFQNNDDSRLLTYNTHNNYRGTNEWKWSPKNNPAIANKWTAFVQDVNPELKLCKKPCGICYKHFSRNSFKNFEAVFSFVGKDDCKRIDDHEVPINASCSETYDIAANAACSKMDGIAAHRFVATPEHKIICDVVDNVRRRKDVRQLSSEGRTSSLEAFHSALNHFAPKYVHFHYRSMSTRVKLAALHFNHNSRRRFGPKKLAITYPKFKKGVPTVRSLLKGCSFEYVEKLMERTFLFNKDGGTDVIPPPVTELFAKLTFDEQKHMKDQYTSRFNNTL